jgi:hypothetical protein
VMLSLRVFQPQFFFQVGFNDVEPVTDLCNAFRLTRVFCTTTLTTTTTNNKTTTITTTNNNNNNLRIITFGYIVLFK